VKGRKLDQRILSVGCEISLIHGAGGTKIHGGGVTLQTPLLPKLYSSISFRLRKLDIKFGASKLEGSCDILN
jgi:hypothetical protein